MYTYSQEHDWKSPQNYSYSQYEGTNFLNSYFLSRKVALKNIKSSLISVKEFANELNIDTKGLSATEISLLEILNSLETLDEIPGNLIFFVRKFEITKLIHNSYNNEENNENYHNLRNYILLSKCCLQAHTYNGSLKFLNTSLKLNDLLIAKLSQIDNQLDKSILKQVIELEISLVEKLVEDY